MGRDWPAVLLCTRNDVVNVVQEFQIEGFGADGGVRVMVMVSGGSSSQADSSI